MGFTCYLGAFLRVYLIRDERKRFAYGRLDMVGGV